ncbi:MAG: o-succinylbenzoate synthase [Rubrobacteraceae bacterium]
MKLAGFSIYRYTLPFNEPVTLGGARFESREGLLLELKDAAGAKGWGETSPLPGFSRESLEEAGHRLYELATYFVKNAGPLENPLSKGLFSEGLKDTRMPPSVRFGLELAVLNLYAASQGKTLPEVFSGEPGTTVALNGLLAGSRDRVLEEARRMQKAGYAAVKLKVGSRNVREDVETVRAVSEVLGEGVDLRLDANRAWNFEEAVEFCRATVEYRYEYLEEPLAEPFAEPLAGRARLRRLAEDYGVPVALDESLVGMEPGELRGHGYARAAVLKPTLLGGVSRALRLAREARRGGILPVISSAYETGVGTSALISLSAGIGDGDIPAGLDTYRRLEYDVYEPGLDLAAPSVDLQQVFDGRVPDLSRLERVYRSTPES